MHHACDNVTENPLAEGMDLDNSRLSVASLQYLFVSEPLFFVRAKNDGLSIVESYAAR